MARTDDSGTIARPVTLPAWALGLVLLGGVGGVGGGVAGIVASPAPVEGSAVELRLDRVEAGLDRLGREVRGQAENQILICDRLDVDCRRAE